MRKKRWVIVVPNSLLRGTECPICQTEPPVMEPCCLPEAQVKDIARKLPGLVWPLYYYSLMLFKVGGNEVSMISPRAIKTDIRPWGS